MRGFIVMRRKHPRDGVLVVSAILFDCSHLVCFGVACVHCDRCMGPLWKSRTPYLAIWGVIFKRFCMCVLRENLSCGRFCWGAVDIVGISTTFEGQLASVVQTARCSIVRKSIMIKFSCKMMSPCFCVVDRFLNFAPKRALHTNYRMCPRIPCVR